VLRSIPRGRYVIKPGRPWTVTRGGVDGIR
jgi:hypothetical protein